MCGNNILLAGCLFGYLPADILPARASAAMRASPKLSQAIPPYHPTCSYPGVSGPPSGIRSPIASHVPCCSRLRLSSTAQSRPAGVLQQRQQRIWPGSRLVRLDHVPNLLAAGAAGCATASGVRQLRPPWQSRLKVRGRAVSAPPPTVRYGRSLGLL